MDAVSCEQSVYLHVEMCSKGNEHKEDWYDETRRNPGSQVRLEIVELHPAENADLNEEEKDAKYSAEGPGQLHNDGHLEVRRFVDGVRCLDLLMKNKINKN